MVLVHPQIAPNTGSIIRLCANTGASLHLVEPLGFSMTERALRRGGLDYHELADVTVYPEWASLSPLMTSRVFGFSSEGNSRYDTISYRDNDWLVFGSESPGLPQTIRDQLTADRLIRIPMRPNNRSLNLANAVSIVVYEAWRQVGFAGADHLGATTSETPASPDYDS